MKIETKTEDGNTDITVLGSSATKGLLNSQIRSLKVPPKSVLSRVKVFSSLDNQLSLNIFSFYNESRLLDSNLQASKADAAHIFDLIKEMRAGEHANNPFLSSLNPEHLTDAAMEEYLTRINSTYAQTSNPRHFLLQKKLFHQVQGTEGVAVSIQSTTQYDGPTAVDTAANAAWISIAAANVLPEVLLKLSSMLLSARDLDINRAHLDTVRDSSVAVPDLPQTGFVTMLRLLVSPDPTSHSTPHIPQSEFQNVLAQDLKRLKWLDEATIQLGVANHPELGILKAEIITGIVSMLQGPLHKVNPQQFSSAKTMLNILELSPHFIQIADSIATLFLERFKPPQGLPDSAFNAQYNEIHNKISRLHHEAARTLLLKMLDTVKLTLRTNIYNPERYALSFRIHPSVMVNVNNPNTTAMPFGVFFSHGRNFNGFHCRFRDIARGGLRIVTPNTADQFVLEGSRQFDEAYGLSFAQQLKNKDIPEVSRMST